MSDPQRLPDDHPRRAQPLQPDKPGSGRGATTPEHPDVSTESTKKAEEQAKTALENVRET